MSPADRDRIAAHAAALAERAPAISPEVRARLAALLRPAQVPRR